MKPLQITLFLIANIIFITQSARDFHQLVFGAEASVLDQFHPEKQKARAEKKTEVLIAAYREATDQIRNLEQGKKYKEVEDIRQEHNELYKNRDALRSEISEREQRSREFRDLWLFSGFGIALIVAGAFLYRAYYVWPGFSILVSGFTLLEYWASPTFFGGATSEFHALLVSKTLLTLLALGLLYGFWRMRICPEPR